MDKPPPSISDHHRVFQSFDDYQPAAPSIVNRRPTSSFAAPTYSLQSHLRRYETSYIDIKRLDVSVIHRRAGVRIRPPNISFISEGLKLNAVDSSEQVHFKLEPLFTMKRLDEYSHAPNEEELLAQLAKPHYDGGNLKDIIHPELWNQMDPEAFDIFSKIAYKCLDDKRQQRPKIDQILKQLEKALKIQKSIASGEVKPETTSDRWKGTPSEGLQIPLEVMQKARKNASQKFLGEGAFGKVYSTEIERLVEDKDTGKMLKKMTKVALKIIIDPQEGKKGFDAEIKLLTKCKHPNVVSLLGFCDEGSEMTLVYEFASNGSLDEYLSNNDNLTWVQRIKIARDIARGLDYLHTRVDAEEENIIHRDIKSGNILLSKNLEAKVADFGLSRFQQANYVQTNIAGTYYYLCPEYYDEKKRMTTAVDIYSFGVVLFEILSGKLANDFAYLNENKQGIAEIARIRFKDNKLNEMVDPIIMEEVDELTSALHRGPNEDSLRTYLEIAYRCIAKEQQHRPTAKEILDELENALRCQEMNKDSLQMSLKEIQDATGEFDPKNHIASGGFGNVYEGEVKRGSKYTKIVAKRFHGKKGQGEEHFFMELEILSDYKHENIIGLQGYCNQKHEKIIVYEHASNSSLDKHLGNVSLTWTKRLQICIVLRVGWLFSMEVLD